MIADDIADISFAYRYLFALSKAPINTVRQFSATHLWHQCLHTNNFLWNPVWFFTETVKRITGWLYLTMTKQGVVILLFDYANNNQ